MSDIIPVRHRAMLPAVSVVLCVTLGATCLAPSLVAAESLKLPDSSESHEPIDFDNQVMPILTRYGCNSGACHGAAIGRGGFALSLFGSRPDRDFDAIVHHLESRRVNVSRPEESLLLRKATETIGHEGGERFTETSEPYKILHDWIDQSTPRQNQRKLEAVLLEPPALRLESPTLGVSVHVFAQFDDGSREDVTRWTVIQSDDPGSVAVSEKNLLDVHRRGSHHVIARFLDRVIPLSIDVPFVVASSTDEHAIIGNLPSQNWIDSFVNQRLDALRIPASRQTTDDEFVRRIYLDLVGRIPSPEERARFVSNQSPQKRALLIDSLVQSDDFDRFWAYRWAEALQIDSKRLQKEGADAYHRWVRNWVQQDAPMDQIAAEMLTTLGDSYEVGAANFLRSGDGPDTQAEYTSNVLMGVRMQCANCHDHPLDHWTQDDYYGLAAIFANLKRGRVVAVSERGEVTHPVTGQPAVAKLPRGRIIGEHEDARAALADWLTRKDNNYLATSFVNRIWAMLMSRGIIDPVDDIRTTNPASHPKLLAALVQSFRANNFRLKSLVRLICNSAAYQRSSITVAENASDLTFYSHWISRPLPAEVVGDMIRDATSIPLRVSGENPERLIGLTDNRSESSELDLLGRCDRTSECRSTSDVSSLSTTLHLMNGDLLNSRISHPQGNLHRLVNSESSNDIVFDHLYNLLFSRPMRPNERMQWRKMLSKESLTSPSKRAVFFEDVMWSLMTSDEFLSNH